MRPDQYYTDVIARPMSVLGRRGNQGAGSGGQAREVEVVAEEEQSFLGRQQQYLAQGLPPSQGQVSHITTTVHGLPGMNHPCHHTLIVAYLEILNIPGNATWCPEDSRQKSCGQSRRPGITQKGKSVSHVTVSIK